MARIPIGPVSVDANGRTNIRDQVSQLADIDANFIDLYASLGSGGSAESQGASPLATAAANTAAINAALALGGTVTLSKPGTYTIACPTAAQTGDSTNTYNVGLVIPSNTRFIVGKGVIIKAAAGITNPCLIQNSNVAGGNVNIEIEGGIWDTNPGNNTRSDSSSFGNSGTGTFCCMAIWLQNITNLKLKNITLLRPLGWGIGVSKVSYGWFENTYFAFTGGTMGQQNNGGYQFEGANSHIYVKNTSGVTYDDMVAFVTQDYGSYAQAMGGPGPVSDVYIDGVIADATTGSWNLIRLLDSTTNKMSRVMINGVSGKYFVRGIVVGGLENQSQVSYMDDIIISNVNLFSGQNVQTFPTIHINNSVQSISINSVKRTIATTESTQKPLIGVIKGTGGDIPAIGSLIIHDCQINDLGSGVGTNLFNLTDGSVTNLIVEQSSYSGSLTAGVGNGNLVGINATAGTVSHLKVANSYANKTQRLVFMDATVTEAKIIGNSFSGQTAAPTDGCIRIRGTVPDLSVVGNCLDMGTAGYTGGIINFNGSTGTTVIRAYGNNLRNVSQPNVGRAATESIRVVSTDMPVPNGILTQAVGDIFLDSSNSNNPYRCSTAPSTFTAL